MLKHTSRIRVKGWENLFTLFTETLLGFKKGVSHPYDAVKILPDTFLTIQLDKDFRANDIYAPKRTLVRVHRDLLIEKPEQCILSTSVKRSKEGKEFQSIELYPVKPYQECYELHELIIQPCKKYQNTTAIIAGGDITRGKPAATLALISLQFPLQLNP